MKFRVKVGKEFELTVETAEKKETNLDRAKVYFLIIIAVGIIASASYGIVSGDYTIFDSVMGVIYKSVRAVTEGT